MALSGGPGPQALEGALALGAEALELRRVEPHAEGQAHLGEDRLDLVERLLAEVLGLEELGLALLHEVGDRPDVGRLETVVRADRQLELVDAPEQVLVQLEALISVGTVLLRLDAGPGSGRGG